VLGLMRQRGYDVSNYQTGEAALDELIRNAQLTPQYRQLAALGQSVLPQWDAFREWQAQQQRADQLAPAQPPAEPPYWDPEPEFDRAWEQFLTSDSGRIVIDPRFVGMVSPELPAKWQRHRDWEQRMSNKLLHDPVEAMKPGLERLIDERARQIVQGMLADDHDTQFANNFAVANKEFLYAHDPNTRQILVQPDGNPVLSEAGQLFAYHVQRLSAAGLKDQAMIAEIAMDLVYGVMAAGAQPQPGAEPPPNVQPGAPQMPPMSPAQQHRETFLGGANSHFPNRGGTLMSPAGQPPVPQNQYQDFGAMLRQRARMTGLVP